MPVVVVCNKVDDPDDKELMALEEKLSERLRRFLPLKIVRGRSNFSPFPSKMPFSTAPLPVSQWENSSASTRFTSIRSGMRR